MSVPVYVSNVPEVFEYKTILSNDPGFDVIKLSIKSRASKTSLNCMSDALKQTDGTGAAKFGEYVE